VILAAPTILEGLGNSYVDSQDRVLSVSRTFFLLGGLMLVNEEVSHRKALILN